MTTLPPKPVVPRTRWCWPSQRELSAPSLRWGSTQIPSSGLPGTPTAHRAPTLSLNTASPCAPGTAPFGSPRLLWPTSTRLPHAEPRSCPWRLQHCPVPQSLPDSRLTLRYKPALRRAARAWVLWVPSTEGEVPSGVWSRSSSDAAVDPPRQ